MIRPRRSTRWSEGDAGVWETRVGDAGWLNSKYYLYEVEVFSRLKGQIVTNVVTDPYSVGLAPNSLKSLVVDLDSPLSKPDCWDLISKPELASPNDIVLYELHIRDFSISDRDRSGEGSRKIHRVHPYFLKRHAAPMESRQGRLDPCAFASGV